jgi:hypothetical protein
MEDDQNEVALLKPIRQRDNAHRDLFATVRTINAIERLHEEFKGSRPRPCCHRRRQTLAMV